MAPGVDAADACGGALVLIEEGEAGIFAHHENAGGVLVDGAFEGDPRARGEEGGVEGWRVEISEVSVIGIEEVGDIGEMGIEERLGGEGEGELIFSTREVGEEEFADFAEEIRGVVEAGGEGALVAEERPGVEEEDPDPIPEENRGMFFEEVEADIDFFEIELGEIAD